MQQVVQGLAWERLMAAATMHRFDKMFDEESAVQQRPSSHDALADSTSQSLEAWVASKVRHLRSCELTTCNTRYAVTSPSLQRCMIEAAQLHFQTPSRQHASNGSQKRSGTHHDGHAEHRSAEAAAVLPWKETSCMHCGQSPPADSQHHLNLPATDHALQLLGDKHQDVSTSSSSTDRSWLIHKVLQHCHELREQAATLLSEGR